LELHTWAARIEELGIGVGLCIVVWEPRIGQPGIVVEVCIEVWQPRILAVRTEEQRIEIAVDWNKLGLMVESKFA
jgi:hypothetical protein